MSTNDSVLHSALRQRLEEGGYTETDAEIIAHSLMSNLLNVQVTPTHQMEEVSCIMAFSWGGQHDKWNNIAKPGPENKALAELAVNHYQQRHVPVCIQWELATDDWIQQMIQPEDLHIYHAKLNPLTAKHDHYPTSELVKDMKAHLADKGVDCATSPVGLLAHRYHMARVVDFAKDQRIVQWASPLAQLPTSMDSNCGYPWIRTAEAAFLSQGISVLAKARAPFLKY